MSNENEVMADRGSEMVDQQHKIEVLNRFMGWEPSTTQFSKATGKTYVVQPFNPYADTPEAREWTRKLKDEFVRRTGRGVHVETGRWIGEAQLVNYWVRLDDSEITLQESIEHHAILDAIYEAIKVKGMKHDSEKCINCDEIADGNCRKCGRPFCAYCRDFAPHDDSRCV